MSFTRRQVLAGTAAGALSAAAQSRRADAPKLRVTPAVCLYSQLLVKIPYDELGPILRSLGVDGCDLSVQPGGHVDPAQAGLHLPRAIEAITGVGLDVPALSTTYTSIQDQTTRNVFGFGGQMGIPLIRVGQWNYPPGGELEPRLGEVSRDLNGLASLAQAVRMSVVVQNGIGDNVGAGLWDMHFLIRGMSPATIGYAFDPAHAAIAAGGPGATAPFRLVQPRLKMIVARDFVWSKEGGAWKAAPCALGEGMVDWPQLFGSLARAKFVGPVSIHVDYQPKDEIAAIRRDVEFIRKQVSAAYV
jgi:sugar phosphate isomerase/epimerase